MMSAMGEPESATTSLSVATLPANGENSCGAGRASGSTVWVWLANTHHSDTEQDRRSDIIGSRSPKPDNGSLMLSERENDTDPTGNPPAEADTVPESCAAKEVFTRP